MHISITVFMPVVLFYLVFYIVRYYHLLGAIAYNPTIICFSQHPT